MVNLRIHISHNTRFVVQHFIRSDFTCDGSTIEDFLFHCSLARDRTELIDSDVGVVAQSGAWATLLIEAAASPSDVTRLASCVDSMAETFLRVVRACQIRLRCLSAYTTVAFDPLIYR